MALYLRARDSKNRHPILGDPYAEELLARIDYDFDQLRRLRGNTALIASRPRQFDIWTQHFLDRHSDGLVLHLACGLDSRPLRVRRARTSRWIDLDYPDVIALRRRLYQLPADVETIAASVTEADWWEHIPTTRPALVLAEGLFMYLTPTQVSEVIDRALTHRSPGTLAFDGVAPWVVMAARLQPSFRRAGTGFHWALSSPPALTEGRPGLTLTDDISAFSLIGQATRTLAGQTALNVLSRFPALRDAVRLVRYQLTA
ncbi:MAG: class I SAM-dependent methyltransferase [Pseudonocardiaceae bacterium]